MMDRSNFLKLLLSAGLATSCAHAQFDSSNPPPNNIRTAATKPAVKPKPIPPAISESRGENREPALQYFQYENGDRIPDYSYAGYAAADSPIPTVPAKLLAAPARAGDNTHALQAAIDQVAKLPPGNDGFRGAVLIPPGRYEIQGQLVINASGVVLRGSGFGENGTTLVATGQDRRPLIHVTGDDDRKYASSAIDIADEYVPIGAMSFRVRNASSFKVGQTIVVRRPCTDEWINSLRMNDLGGGEDGWRWKADSRETLWDRTITKIDGQTITVDAPITMGIDARLGRGNVYAYNWPGRVSNVGVENLSLEGADKVAHPKDEDHAWFGVSIDNARDVWVRQIVARKFASSAVAVWESGSRVTVEDCKSLEPISEIGGLRRYSFYTSGQQVLMQRLYSENGFHDFAVGYAAAGPNAFVQVESSRSYGESGAIESASSGTLFDKARIDRQPISLKNRDYLGQAIGWTAFGSTLWNCSSPVLEAWNPPGSRNWVFGADGEFSGDASWFGSNDDVSPTSLYYAQLRDRKGADAARRAYMIIPPVQGSRASTIPMSAEASEVSRKPRVTVGAWVDLAPSRTPIPVDAANLPVAAAPGPVPSPAAPTKVLSIKNGWLVVGDKLAVGGQADAPWWSGGIRPNELNGARASLTRFVPGRTGHGLTDSIEDVVSSMVRSNRAVFRQYPPLWYERRRDDHVRMHRMDGEVVAPFYEWPYARSGEDSANDGLSKWDLTKLNPWYFSRLQKFSELAAQNGLILFNGNYMQHSILEAGGHFADYPWKTSNNINDPGFPEPTFFAGDKLIYIAEQFYDVESNAKRRELHRNYIRKSLEAIGDRPNVVTYLSEEFTGPLGFTQFWLDTIGDWEKETGKNAIVALHAPKDVQDAILADPKRSAVVDMLYSMDSMDGWHYEPDGSVWSAQGGKSLSPRQWGRLRGPKGPGFNQVVQAVREYRVKYPEKPFHYSSQSAWAVLIGGGSIPNLALDDALKAAIPAMKPTDLPGNPKNQWVLADAGNSYLVYNGGNDKISIDLSGLTGTFNVNWVDARSGKLSKAEPVKAGGVVSLSGSSKIVWLSK